VHAVTPELAEQFRARKAEGVVVVAVDQNTPAARVGIKPGDIIASVNHREVSTPGAFQEAIEKADLKKGVILIIVNPGSTRFELLQP
jgi:S1-C subfamily serine protease